MNDVRTANRDYDRLHYDLRRRLGILEDVMRRVGHPVFLTEGWRSDARQDWLYAQGRDEEGEVVTHARAGQSAHNYGLAADYAFETQPIYDESHPWEYLGATARVLGLEWGGDWRSPDRPHVQLNLSPVAGGEGDGA